MTKQVNIIISLPTVLELIEKVLFRYIFSRNQFLKFNELVFTIHKE